MKVERLCSALGRTVRERVTSTIRCFSGPGPLANRTIEGGILRQAAESGAGRRSAHVYVYNSVWNRAGVLQAQQAESFQAERNCVLLRR